MQKPALPDNEAARLASVRELGLMYTAADERYDRITRMASRLLGAPIALVTLLDDRVQWFKSNHGLDASETPKEVSFCGHAILADDVFVIEDALKDERFADNPLVTGSPDIRFYAGQPLHAPDGMRVGALCVIDREPRKFAQDDRDTLRDLGALVEAELAREALNVSQRAWLAERDDLVVKASIDSLTRAWNRGAIMELLNGEISRGARGTPLSVAMIDIDWFKRINDTRGHQIGDAVLTETAARIRSAVRDFDKLGRYGGEEFLLVLGHCAPHEATMICERVRAKVTASPVATTEGAALSVSISVGVAAYGGALTTAETLIGAADAALYRAKANGRNRVEA